VTQPQSGSVVQPDDAIGSLVEKLVIAAAVVAVILVALPLVVPVIAAKVAGEQMASRARFCTT
jgi:hypothetical protein